MAAVLASFLLAYALCAALGIDASPAVLAAVLALSLSRDAERPTASAFAARLVALPVVAIGAVLVGWVLHANPWIGAALFCGGIFLSIWLRGFGERAAKIGATIALPLIAILVVPVRVVTGRGWIVDVALVLAAGAIAVLCTGLAAYLTGDRAVAHVARARTNGDGKIPVGTRMALQMTVALVAAFAIGLFAFPAHWPWIVLTAFIVCSGALGRCDALYKGALRLGGAIAGTLVAALLPHAALPNPTIAAAVLFGILFLGMWLRTINYAYWAACATLLFALLQPPQSAMGAGLFAARLECILIGAICAVAAAWFVYPIETESVVRLRLAAALAALAELLDADADEREAKRALFEHHVRQLERVAPPVELHRRLVPRDARDEHPAAWIATARAVFAYGRIAAGRPGDVDDTIPRAIGTARRAIRDRSGIADALRRLHDLLQRDAGQGAGV